MAIEFTNIFHCKDTPKFAQIGIFGLKICHLATLQPTLSLMQSQVFPFAKAG
jgi:hypothetical protein